MIYKLISALIIAGTVTSTAHASTCGQEVKQVQSTCIKRATQKLLSQAYAKNCFKKLSRDEINDFKNHITITNMDCLSKDLIYVQYNIELECGEIENLSKSLKYENGRCH